MGTALNKILKDSYIRFFRMSGFKVWDQPGYDTHGLPIENKVEQMLNFKSKSDIEKFGIDKFIEECRKFSTKFIVVMSNEFNNLGVWMDWNNPYLTLTNGYIEGHGSLLKERSRKGCSTRDCTRFMPVRDVKLLLLTMKSSIKKSLIRLST